jgi:hypothetical protein
VPGNRSIFSTPKVVNSPGQIEDDIARLRHGLQEPIAQRIHREEDLRFEAAQPKLKLPEDRLTDGEGVAAPIRVTGGNPRLLHRLLAQVGRILAINGLRTVTCAVVEAAREVLVIGAAEPSAIVDGCARHRGPRGGPVAWTGGRATVATATNQLNHT